eukprot:96090-Rhodomonas_salina.3
MQNKPEHTCVIPDPMLAFANFGASGSEVLCLKAVLVQRSSDGVRTQRSADQRASFQAGAS